MWLLYVFYCHSDLLKLKYMKWSKEKANSWYEEQPWLVGCNFLPSSAINQLEMFQEDTFDEKTIERELDWAKDLGFNSLRVYSA